MIQVTIKMFAAFLVACYLSGLKSQKLISHSRETPIRSGIPWWGVIGPEFPVSFRRRSEIMQKRALAIFLIGRMLTNKETDIRDPGFRQKSYHPLFHRLFTSGPVASQLLCPMIDMKMYARRNVQVLRGNCKHVNIISVHPVLPLVAYLNRQNRQEHKLVIEHLSLDRERVIRTEFIDIIGDGVDSIMVFHPKSQFLAISCGYSVKLYGLSVDGTGMFHQIGTLKHSCQVTSISFSSNDFPVLKIATGDKEGNLMISSIRLGFFTSVELLHSLQSPFENFTADLGHLDSSHHDVKSMEWWGGNTLVAAYCNKYLAVIRCNGKKFDVRTYELSINVKCVGCVTIHPSGRFFILSCNQFDFVAYDIETLEDRCVFRVPSSVRSMAFTLDGKILAMGGVDINMVEVSQDGKRMIILARHILPWSQDICSIAVHENVVLSADWSSALVTGRFC